MVRKHFPYLSNPDGFSGAEVEARRWLLLPTLFPWTPLNRGLVTPLNPHFRLTVLYPTLL